jgi:hypothetical protein
VEKISIKPNPTEILIKNEESQEISDVFCYDYHSGQQDSGETTLITSGDEIKQHGSLFIVGHIEPKNEDTSYILSLVSSLAKREYYTAPLIPKKSFSKTLRRVNDVLDDFFKSKDIKVNIGIFAVAGENIYISKLGKFKIILSRDNQNIDILNNINLFSKDQAQEQEFSSVVSGKITPGDKILAYYPNRSITSRERVLKNSFLKLDPSKFIQKLNAIKEEKSSFACTAIYLTITKHKELAVNATLASNLTEHHTPIEHTDFHNKSGINESPSPQNTIDKTPPPIIRPNEFSTNTKTNFFSSILKSLVSMFSQIGNLGKYSFKKRATLFLSILLVIVLFTVAKLFLFQDPQSKLLKASFNEAEENTRLAQTKISQNDFIGARELLFSTISNVSNIEEMEGSDTIKTNELKVSLFKLLDNIDNATEISASLVDALPEDLSKTVADKNNLWDNIEQNKYNINSRVSDIAVYADNLYALTSNNILKVGNAIKGATNVTAWLKESTVMSPDSFLITIDGDIFVLEKSGVLSVYYKGEKNREFSTLLVPNPDNSLLLTTEDSNNIYLIDKDFGRIYIILKESGTLVKTLVIGNDQPIINAHLSEVENIYFVTQDNKIWQVKPAAQ